MTREEAKNWFLDHMPMKIIMSAAYDAYSAALSALRPVSREQVEKVWRGEWIEYEHPHIICCTRCDYGTGPEEKTRFCPYCGAPMTDEAVEMVMERLEALKDGKGD